MAFGLAQRLNGGSLDPVVGRTSNSKQNMNDPMQKWKDQGKTPAGLRQWSEAIGNRPELRCGYCQCVLVSAADEMERMQSEISRLNRELNETKQLSLV